MQGMIFLRKIGFTHLGNVHLGNIFLARGEEGEPGSDVCTISGHENTLFGFTNPLYDKLKDVPGFLEGIDVIMFGELGMILQRLIFCRKFEVLGDEVDWADCRQ